MLKTEYTKEILSVKNTNISHLQYMLKHEKQQQHKPLNFNLLDKLQPFRPEHFKNKITHINLKILKISRLYDLNEKSI